MKVKCIANTGDKLLLTTINNSGDTIETKYPIKIGELYVIYGQHIYNNVLSYLLIGTYENLPSWYPAELFEVKDTVIPMEWYYQYDSQSILSAIWGYNELVLDENHYDSLLEREDEGIRIFLKRKKEIDAYYE
jgi:hypothetical protein